MLHLTQVSAAEAGLLLTVGLGALVGLSLGLAGGGGSILAVPLLVYGLTVPARQAVGVSLAAVGSTALVGGLQRLWRREVEIKTGLLFALAGMVGAPLGTWIGSFVSETLLLVLFAGLMVGVAVRMWRKATTSPEEASVVRAIIEPRQQETGGPACRRDPSGTLSLTSRCFAVLLIAGVVTGILAGLFGVGGGFVIVPALVLLTSMDIRKAVATSLLAIALISGAGLVSHIFAGRDLAPEIALPFAAGGIAGLGFGTILGRRMSPVALQKGFAVLIVLVAAYVIAQSVT